VNYLKAVHAPNGLLTATGTSPAPSTLLVLDL
jgi:hypothetical protein